MATERQKFKTPSFARRILTIVGGYGSGKSEVAVNLARFLSGHTDRRVAIADLDIVNPYFRSREATARLLSFGIEPIHPDGAYTSADLPIILPGVRGAIEHFDGWLILDVGGDDVGARVLGSLRDAFPPGDHDLLLVLNANRPFTSSVAACRNLMAKIESASGLRFTGIISNTHLMEYTTPQTVLDGLSLARALSRDSGLPISFVSALDDHLTDINDRDIDVPVLVLDRLLLKPWERPRNSRDTESQ